VSELDATTSEVRAAVARWRALARMGVPLSIPGTPIPYCETDRSTLHWLGWDAYERRDEWHAYEQGHGRYGSVERTDLSHDELDAALAILAERSPERVVPWTSAMPDGERASPGETLPRVRAGELALTRWYEPAEGGVTDLVAGDGEALFWLRQQGAKLVRVERLDGGSLSLLEALPLARSAVITATAEHAALARRAREHLARHDAFVRALEGDPSLFVGPSDGREGSTRGTRFPWISFWDARAGAGPMLVDPTSYTVARVVARALFEHPSAAPRPLDPALRDALSRSEDALHALYDALHRGAVAYQLNTSISTWWVWVDGVACEVDVTPDRNPCAAVEKRSLRSPTMDCASRALRGSHPDRFHPVDPVWIAKARALIAR